MRFSPSTTTLLLSLLTLITALPQPIPLPNSLILRGEGSTSTNTHTNANTKTTPDAPSKYNLEKNPVYTEAFITLDRLFPGWRDFTKQDWDAQDMTVERIVEALNSEGGKTGGNEVKDVS